jgi:hypothetical protein
LSETLSQKLSSPLLEKIAQEDEAAAKAASTQTTTTTSTASRRHLARLFIRSPSQLSYLQEHGELYFFVAHWRKTGRLDHDYYYRIASGSARGFVDTEIFCVKDFLGTFAFLDDDNSGYEIIPVRVSSRPCDAQQLPQTAIAKSGFPSAKSLIEQTYQHQGWGMFFDLFHLKRIPDFEKLRQTASRRRRRVRGGASCCSKKEEMRSERRN